MLKTYSANITKKLHTQCLNNYSTAITTLEDEVVKNEKETNQIWIMHNKKEVNTQVYKM